MLDKEKDINPTELKIKICRDEGRWFIENDDFDIIGDGDPLREAFYDFGEKFEMLFDYLKIKDELLSEDGKKYKKKLIDAFGRWFSEEGEE